MTKVGGNSRMEGPPTLIPLRRTGIRHEDRTRGSRNFASRS